MKPKTLVKSECANYNRSDGSCWPTGDECLIRTGHRCGYFETCVLPLADQPSPKDDPKLQKQRAEARTAYHDKHGIVSATKIDKRPECPDCGSILPAGRKYGRCDSCRKAHDREITRQRVRDHRNNAVGV